MAKHAKDDIKCERYITDFRGREICPGNVVAVSRSGRGARKLEMYIVGSVSKSMIFYAEKTIKSSYSRDPVNNQYNYSFELVGAQARGSRSHLFKEEMQEHIVVVDNPLYAIHNPQIKSVIEIADALRGYGVFPEDYKLGEPIMEFEESDE